MKINPTFLFYSIIFPFASILKFAMSLAPVPYVSTFRSKDLETTKFIQVLPDHTEKHEVNTYTGREGLEAVIHCNTRFLRVALKCNWTPQQKFEKYEKVIIRITLLTLALHILTTEMSNMNLSKFHPTMRIHQSKRV